MLAIDLHAVHRNLATVEDLGGAHVHRHAIVGREALDVAEDEDGRGGLLEADLVERADLEVWIGSVDVFEVAHVLGEFQRLAQVRKCLGHHSFAFVEPVVHELPPLSPAGTSARLAAAIRRLMSGWSPSFKTCCCTVSVAFRPIAGSAQRRNFATISSRADNRLTGRTSIVSLRPSRMSTRTVSGSPAGTWRMRFISD